MKCIENARMFSNSAERPAAAAEAKNAQLEWREEGKLFSLWSAKKNFGGGFCQIVLFECFP